MPPVQGNTLLGPVDEYPFMKPGTYDLPVIWRGSTYSEIVFTWLDANGNPMNLTGWIPRARSLNIDFHPEVVDPGAGTTSISFTRQETATFKLGIEQWDWIWESEALSNNIRTGPFIHGRVEIRDPETTTSMEQPFTSSSN